MEETEEPEIENKPASEVSDCMVKTRSSCWMMNAVVLLSQLVSRKRRRDDDLETQSCLNMSLKVITGPSIYLTCVSMCVVHSHRNHATSGYVVL